ncbi:Far1-related sequence 3 [Hibiscus syriacus]|uniref:Far1-related sequence 3 n=1 Tax=Hibiscus syriacus TaxID=106335 RepID=A0A6A2Y3M5_HIBSY|nr:uncharacterized protein LOC120182959 [Hibiscus syriacus]KAE8664727.1 Far1-related sequence 3 [Hibiscus syriacus]
MGLQRLKLGVRVSKFMLISVKICYRSIWNHPFLVGLICLFMLLYTSFPSLFSALVTASPVLVCTAVLLGTLLSFGSPYIPEIDEEKGEEEKVSHEVSELKTGAPEDHTVADSDVGDDDFVVERHVGKRWGKVENAEEKVNLVDNEVGEVEEDDGSVRYKLLVNDDLDSRDIHCEGGVIDEVEESSNDTWMEKKREIQEKILGSEGLFSLVEASDDDHVLADVARDRNLEVEHKLKEDHNKQRGNEFDSSSASSWKCPVDDEDDGDGVNDDDESLDSGSDGAESSPDASMADIIPMLDEFHPLLGSNAPQLAQLSADDSDASSERSHGSNNDESVESGEIENQGEEDSDEDEGEGEKEGEKGDKEDESKSAIKWTEDDQKNLMDLGTSELERNQRLHNLIARRRARKGMGLMIERSLIDLESADIPLNITPISVARRNPFEFPHDSYDDLGLPPMPGSAPTIFQPRRNPFDLPYDSGEEKPDLKGDSFQEEFAGFNQRETVSQRGAFLRRHESFNVGPSSLGVTRKELKWKPYFVPETEGSNPSSFQRQLSEVSESMLSSVPDTESVSSVVDEEDSKSCGQDISQETELIVNEVHASSHDEQESLSSGYIKPANVEQVENRDVHPAAVETTLGDGKSQLEMESNFPEPGTSAHRELNGIEIEPMPHFGQPENTDVHRDVVAIESGDGENQKETESFFSEAGATIHVELNPSEIYSKTKSVDEDFSGGSSLSLSEIDEKILDASGEGSAGFEPTGHEIKGSGIFSQPSFEESEFHFTAKVMDDKHSEPVYDSSPSVEKVPFFSSVSSDGQAVTSEMGASSMLVESTDKEPEGHAETIEQGICSFQKMHAAFSDLLENEQKARDLPGISECGVTHAGSLSVSTSFSNHNVSMVPESVVEYVSRDAVPSSSDEGSEHGVPNQEEGLIQNQVDLLCLGAGMTLAVDQGIDKMMDSSPEGQRHLGNRESSKAEPGDRHAVDREDTQLERDEIHPSSSLEHDIVWPGVFPKEEIIQTECDQMHLSNFDASLDVDGHHDEGQESCHTAVAQVSQDDPSEANLREVHRNESEMDEVEPTCLESKIDTGLDHDTNLEGISSNSNYQAALTRENPSPELENLMSGSDISIDEPFIDEDVKLEEPCIIAMESVQEVDIGNNDLNVHNISESEDKVSTNYSSMISDSASSPSESPENTLPTDQEDLKGRVLNEMEREGISQEVSEHFNRAAEVYATYDIEENNSEEDDNIEEIDEGILSELDTAGVFNVEKIDLPEGSHVANTESALLPEVMKIETDVELSVLEARSTENIDLTFKQLHEGVDVEEVILPSIIKNQQDHADTHSKLPVVEEKSLEDIHTAFQLSSDLQNGPSEIEQNDAVSAKEIESSNAVSGIKENRENAASEPSNEYEEASEKSSLNLKGKKSKSHDSSSSSSSSSTSSDSE